MKRPSAALLVLAFALVLPAPADAQPDDYAFTIARIKYDGGGDWYSDPESLPQLLSFVRENTLLDVAPREDIVELSSERIYAYPYVYMTGHGNIRLRDDEALLLRDYLEGGGFLHVDDNYGLDEHLRREMRKVFPDREFVELPFSHEIYHTQFEFPNGLPKIHEHDGEPPQGYALLDDDGRVMVYYTHETDLGDGWEPASVHENPENMRLAALRMGANILTYAMTN